MIPDAHRDPDQHRQPEDQEGGALGAQRQARSRPQSDRCREGCTPLLQVLQPEGSKGDHTGGKGSIGIGGGRLVHVDRDQQVKCTGCGRSGQRTDAQRDRDAGDPQRAQRQEPQGGRIEKVVAKGHRCAVGYRLHTLGITVHQRFKVGLVNPVNAAVCSPQ